MAIEPKVITIQNPAKAIFKASGATIAALLGLIFIGVEWGHKMIDLSFVTDDLYAADIVKMEKKVSDHESVIENRISQLAIAQEENAIVVKDLSNDFTTLTRNLAIADAVDLYNSAEDAVYVHRQLEVRDGASQSSKVRADELERRRIAARDYRDCVLHDEPNCYALRPR